ncbi:hypothetical protein HUO13_30480 [Saccharopolyspora erythraea]|uniref:hypothetical protein n=1 Tax=Saccharopolyspora erythraea TaxID=1836 RepID=UPI001BADB9BB|nr:hypothetical protein [Saccharopolyspora erythraea]QUH04528.1 hypothetical protein HUO13_30480 [Saccharopolyspora erythraea]
MAGIDPIRDIRFEGMDIPQLQQWIAQIKHGRGTESMNGAVRGLEQCVQVVVDLDNTLRTELAKLQIHWEGNAGSMAQAATRAQTAVMQESQDPLAVSAASVDAQGRGYESAKHTLPEAGDLQAQQSENFLEWSGGAFGYESDYDAEAKQIQNRQLAAQSALGSYRDTSVQQADAYQPLPEMAPASVSAQSATVGGSGVGGGGFAFSGVGGGGVGGGAVGGGGTGGGFGGHSGVLPGGGDYSGGDGSREGGGRSGAGGLRESSGTGGYADRNTTGPTNRPGLGLGPALGLGAGGAAVAGLGAAAAGKMLGGGKGGAGSVRGGDVKGGIARGGSSGVGGGPGDTTAGRTAGSSATSRPGPGSMMGPAATRGEKKDDDVEHDNQYVVEETPFDDNRLVAPAVLGEDREHDEAGEAGEADQPKKQD